MAVPVQTPLDTSTANGATSVFPYSFLIFDEADLLVERNGVAAVLNVDYTVDGVGNSSGGNVTFLTGNPANGTVISRRRQMAYKRDIDYQFQGDFLAAEVNPDQDAPIMMIQQLALALQLSFQLPPQYLGSVSPVLPAPQALYSLRWNGALNALENYLPTPVSAPSGSDQVGFQAAGANTVARTIQSKLREWKSVQDYGAVPNTGADQTAAINTAIAAAVAGGFDLLFPDGDYTITGTLTQTGVVVMGALSKYGRAKIIKTGTGDLFSGQSAVLMNLQFVHQGSSGRILDLTGDGARAENCSFTNAAANTSDMVHCTRSDHYFGRNYFTNNNASAFGIHVERTAAGICINGAIDAHNTFGGIGKGVKFTSSSAGNRPEGWTISNNVFILTGAEHILVNTVLHLTIANNVIDQASVYCINLAPTTDNIDGVTISNNYLATASAPTTGIAVETNNGAGSVFNTKLIGNNVEQSGTGFRLRAKVTNAIVSANTFANINVVSLSVEGCSYVTVLGNSFRGTNQFLLINDVGGGYYVFDGNVLATTGSVSFTFTNRDRYSWGANQGLKLSGYCTALATAAAGAAVALSIPHGLPFTPDIRKVRINSIVQESGSYELMSFRVDTVDATNINGGLFYTRVSTGNLRVNAYVEG